MTVEPVRSSLDELLAFVKATRGFDFAGYKRSSIERRVAKRMGEAGVDDYGDYVAYLERYADEFAELFNTLLINVTSFFRDPPTWEHLATEILPQLISARDGHAPLRVWCPGCASGEEAYTVAMVLARVLGDGEFRDRVKIYATDVDEEALAIARQGVYHPRQVEDIPREALERFFERGDQRYAFRKDLRRSVIFGRNDLIQDAPISRIDLLVCRNTLMYFTAETQARILRRFHFALNDAGVLLLGKSEMLLTHGDLFTPIDLKWRVFRKVGRRALGDRVRVLAVDPSNGASQSLSENLREAAFDIGRGAQIVLDAHRTLVMANRGARSLFGLRAGDLGRAVQDLELSYRPVELRGHLDALERDPRGVDLVGVRWRDGERERVFDVHVVPMLAGGALLGCTVVYDDMTDAVVLETEVTTARRELEQACQELQSTVEELETTNEELETTNEELETTNEELETTNEELQAINEELETMNDELRHRTLELNEMNTFLDTILTTIGWAVAVVDSRHHVQVWNGQAREMWGLTSDEAADQHLLALEIGLPVQTLETPLRRTLSGESGREDLVVDAVNRRGRAFRCRVVVLPVTADRDRPPTGAILLMEPAGETRPPAAA